MKRFITITIGIIGLLMLAGCANSIADNNGSYANQPNDSPTTPYTTQPSDPTPPYTVQQTEPTPTPHPPTDQPSLHTLEELGTTIVAAGEFWNSWWASHHTFEWEHIDNSRQNWQPWDETLTPAHHPLSRGFAVILPSSGFTRFYEIGDHLLQFYTQTWVDRGFFSEPAVVMQASDGNEYTVFGFEGFETYDNELFVFIQTEMSIRPDWSTAIHTLIEQDGSRAVVETIVSTSIYGFDGGGEMPTITYRFTLIDGRIDNAYGRWHDAPSSYVPYSPQGLYVPTRGDNMLLFIYRAEDVVLGSFDELYTIGHPSFFDDSTDHGDDILIGATRTMYNVSLILFEDGWDESAGEVTYTIQNSFMIAHAVTPGEGILITGYMSLGTLPWSGIMFDDALERQHFFAINHDNTDRPYWFAMWDITEQIRFE